MILNERVSKKAERPLNQKKRKRKKKKINNTKREKIANLSLPYNKFLYSKLFIVRVRNEYKICAWLCGYTYVDKEHETKRLWLSRGWLAVPGAHNWKRPQPLSTVGAENRCSVQLQELHSRKSRTYWLSNLAKRTQKRRNRNPKLEIYSYWIFSSCNNILQSITIKSSSTAEQQKQKNKCQ